MKKILLLLVVALLVIFKLATVPVYSDELDDINKQISDLQGALSSSQKATAPLESQLKNLQTQLTGIQNRVSTIEKDISTQKKIIDSGYKDLAKNKDIFNRTVRDYYIKTYSFNPLLVFLSSEDAGDITRFIVYQKKGADRDKDTITSIALKISDLEERQKKLEDEESRLAEIKKKIEPQQAEIAKIVKGAKDYQSSLSSKIADLSAKQQDILSQRLSSLHIPQSAYAGIGGGCSSDLTNGKNPGFSPRIAFFTFGVPNRVGLNQYGAKGRAEAGQNAETILKAYYNADLTSGYNTGINIHVTGTNEYGQSFDDNWNIEEYVKHVYEVPSNWPSETLKAQAIAARSYALARTNNGANAICPSQSCQVVKKELNAQSWIDAVNATSGQVLTNGGNPISAWFSSTHGGYVYQSGGSISGAAWTKNAKDTTTDSISSISDLQSSAYDKSSPWFYCDWGSRSQYSGTAWLKPDEVADIVNVILLARKDSSAGKHLYQTDKPNPEGTDTWSADQVRSQLGGGYHSISDISTSIDFGSGKTGTVTVNGDAGSQSFSADEFKNWFNLRAPANLQIVGPLYNVEKQ